MYDLKKATYFSNTRDDLIALIPEEMKSCSVLEVGCGTGSTLKKLKELGIALTTVGIELFPLADNHYNDLDQFYSDNIETMNIPSDFNKTFDLIILGDILEHLIDPWKVLHTLSKLLKTDGYILLSIPNIQYYQTLMTIIKGDFRYEEAGILDQTHLRFFCKKNIVDLVEKSNLKVDLITSSFDQESAGKRYWLNKIFCNRLHGFFVYQYLVRAKKNTHVDH